VAFDALTVFGEKMPVVAINRKRSESARAWAFETQGPIASTGPAAIAIADNLH